MLQQTQVKTVIPYFNNFVKKIPNLKALSESSEKKILKRISHHKNKLNFLSLSETIFPYQKPLSRKEFEPYHFSGTPHPKPTKLYPLFG